MAMAAGSYDAQSTPREGDRRLHSAITLTAPARVSAAWKWPGRDGDAEARFSRSDLGSRASRTSTIRFVAATMLARRSAVTRRLLPRPPRPSSPQAAEAFVWRHRYRSRGQPL